MVMITRTRLRHRAIQFIGKYPLLFFPSVSIRKRFGQSQGVMTVTRETELVIEGFLRSANSFATRAFLISQPRKVLVANRSHVPATVIRSVQWNIPTLVLIREPMETILSYLMKKPYITAEDGFREYIAYYSSILPYRDHFVIATFEEVTTDYGRVIERVNRRFDTNFTLFSHTEENVQKVFEIIERVDRNLAGGDLSKFSVPSAEKEKIKQNLRKIVEADEMRSLVETARSVYRNFTEEPSMMLQQETA